MLYFVVGFIYVVSGHEFSSFHSDNRSLLTGILKFSFPEVLCRCKLVGIQDRLDGLSILELSYYHLALRDHLYVKLIK